MVDGIEEILARILNVELTVEKQKNTERTIAKRGIGKDENGTWRESELSIKENQLKPSLN